MSDRQFGKKMVEEGAFYYFANAYEHVTRERLEIVASCERPDFLCSRCDGSICGLELTQVRRDPETMFWDRAIHKINAMSADDARHAIYAIVNEKERKRGQTHWQLPDAAILVVELTDCSLTELDGLLNDSFCADLADSSGFQELWLADFTTCEAFSEVQLFGVSPEKWRGIYERAHPNKKPYG